MSQKPTSKAAHEYIKPHKPSHKRRNKRNNPELFTESLEGEEWKEIVGYEGRFEISNFGRCRTIARFVKRKKQPHYKQSFIKRQRITQHGYATVYLSIDKKYKHMLVHRLVALHFISDMPLHKRFINHKNGNKLNNHVSNLEWCTPSENLKHAFRTGLMCQNGERHPSNKLNNNQVLNIFKSTLPAKQLAKKYRVSIGTISCIKRGDTWSHITKKEYKKAGPRLYQFGHEELTMLEIMGRTGLLKSTLRWRLDSGWDKNRIISTPAKQI